MYYRGAQAAIVVYDITNADTFSRAKVWVKELQRQAAPNIVIALAGNKADLAAKRQVEVADAEAYAEGNGLIFMETSAKTAMNVNDIFMAIAKKLPKTQDSNQNGSGGRGNDRSITVDRPANPRAGASEGGCCGGSAKWSDLSISISFFFFVSFYLMKKDLEKTLFTNKRAPPEEEAIDTYGNKMKSFCGSSRHFSLFFSFTCLCI